MTGPCAKDPCMNNGKCSNTQTSFECDCIDGFSGDRCDVTPCSSKPCLNDGKKLKKIFTNICLVHLRSLYFTILYFRALSCSKWII